MSAVDINVVVFSLMSIVGVDVVVVEDVVVEEVVVETDDVHVLMFVNTSDEH